ncbi:MAG: CRISPR-associated protein, Csm1 family [uncultured Thiotrichaceae bacterium]|uniref:CRISPR system single-strand-specific deoxyribonuclease Cas10/Csm1 (subtype III-A) n=1 Tax=uncultured Thiotrichaceae bacterium TaxID=298394 RepID=A0A6S6TLZ5_9GAMM|nr:MAG: CRISPR-associated protein, Csm1 family [uncultured Thiotrichaceae bacterium]
MKNSDSLLDPSCRIALAAFLHDMGKFAERARLEIDKEMLEVNKQLYCPHRKAYTDAEGYFTHVHAAYTGVAMDLLEEHMPELVGDQMFPFASWESREIDDSLVNAAAKHHKPDTFLQWVIATADRVASGFEREEFEEYNQAEEKKNHYTTKQLTLFEQISIKEKQKATDQSQLKYRYALKSLSPDSIFPVLASEAESTDRKKAQQEYRALWDEFAESLQLIPDSHRQNLSLWLDHFESLWGSYTHCIPSATVGKTKADVSLYDHSKTTAALATALWRYHHESGDTTPPQDSWDTDKFLLIQGDFFGIQSFIFSEQGETNKYAAKLLRGRSFYVSLLTECAALKVLQELGLPSTSQIINAAGKFLIVAPNTNETKETLAAVQAEFNQWFLKKTWGQSGVGLAWQEASCTDFTSKNYEALISELYKKLDQAKFQKMDLCETSTPAVFDEYLDLFDNTKGICQIDGRSPAETIKDGVAIGALAKDQIDCGRYIVNKQLDRLMIAKTPLEKQKSLRLTIFGFYISFTGEEAKSGKFGEFAGQGKLLRAWDYSLPVSANSPLWNGYARRNINSSVPFFDDTSALENNYDKYAGCDDDGVFQSGVPVKSFCHLASEDKYQDKDHWQGKSGLMALKGDIDDLGMMFQKGIAPASFAKMASLSRQINAFFAIYLPWLCRHDGEFSNVYTVFAGGDDFFMIGPWHTQMKLARKIQQDFKRYVAENEEIHFSVGFSMTKPGVPVPYLAESAEKQLEAAKGFKLDKNTLPTKNAVTCFGETMAWDTFVALGDREDALDEFKQDFALSTGYVYGLLDLVNMRENKDKKPENAMWHSYFAYRTRRLLERKKLSEQQILSKHQSLANEISAKGIEQYGANYRVALFSHLYKHRN